MPSATDSAIETWLATFEQAVRARDYASGRALFDDDARGFGSVVMRYDGIEALVTEQWQRVWAATRGFSFDRGELALYVDGTLATVATTWSSTGIADDDSTFARAGRVTLVLRHDGLGYRCCHSHYSLAPNRG